MENLKTKIVWLSVLALLGVTMTGCEGKSDEEKLTELKEQMNNAKSLKEITAISKRIEELKEKMKSNMKTTKVVFGKPITYWEKNNDSGTRISQFQITFRDPTVSSSHPIPRYASTSATRGKKYFGMKVDLKNLGPRETSTGGRAEVKVNNGNIYRLRYVDEYLSYIIIEPGKSKIGIFITQIPEDTYPVEVFGELGSSLYSNNPYAIKFSLKLTQFKR